MMNILHLLWIVPLAATVGMAVTAFCQAAKEGDKDNGDENH